MGICPSLCHTGDKTNFVLTACTATRPTACWTLGTLVVWKPPSFLQALGKVTVNSWLLLPWELGLFQRHAPQTTANSLPFPALLSPWTRSLSGARGSWRGVGEPGASFGRSVDWATTCMLNELPGLLSQSEKTSIAVLLDIQFRHGLLAS